MHFFEVEKVTCPDKSDFYQNYVTGSQPIILKDLSKNWPARDKWTFDFFKKEYGEMEVPMYD
ncbi:cupin-like domain-containing protein [Flavobacteriaceae bacterium]|nr:cupin-like domain-containing protein [Flavobacteriaceae bacterium]